jgi:rhodanese-related sulfurtransferase
MYAGLKYYAITGEGLIPSETAKDLIESGEISRIIDVRTNFEWSRGHYKGAKHLPTSSITAKSLVGLSKNEGNTATRDSVLEWLPKRFGVWDLERSTT